MRSSFLQLSGRIFFVSTVIGLGLGCTLNNHPSSMSRPAVPPSVARLCPPAETTTLLTPQSATDVVGQVVLSPNWAADSSRSSPGIEGVLVIVFSGLPESPEKLYRTESNHEGRFSFDETFEPGLYQLLTCLEGWDSVQVELSITEDSGQLEIKLPLKPS